MGIEPTSSAWEAEVLPLNYTRINKLIRNLVFQCNAANKHLEVPKRLI